MPWTANQAKEPGMIHIASAARALEAQSSGVWICEHGQAIRKERHGTPLFKSGHFTQTLVVDQRIWFVDVRRATSGKQSPLGDCGGSGSIHGPLKIGLV